MSLQTCASLSRCLQRAALTRSPTIAVTIPISSFNDQKKWSNFHIRQSGTAHVRKMSTGVAISPPPERLRKPMEVPNKLLMGPGPSNCSPAVLAASALPLLGHLHPEFCNIMDDVKEGIQYVFQTRNEWTFAVPGSGHAAMETAAINLLESGEVALVSHNGLWGGRFADMVERNEGVVRLIETPMGQACTMDRLEQALTETKPAVLFMTYGESSSGVAQPLEGVGELCRKHQCLLVVDSVAAMGGIPLFMDKWGIDVLYSGSQKVLSCPPAPSPISFSDRAREKVLNRKTKVRSWYLDAIELANYWGCDDLPRRYHHTAMISCVYALREGLAEFAAKGLEQSWKDQKKCARLLYDGLEALGLEMWVEEEALRNPCVTTVKVPDGIEAKDVVDYAMKQHKVEISGGLGSLAGKVWRIGLMGNNCTPECVQIVLKVLGEALKQARK